MDVPSQFLWRTLAAQGILGPRAQGPVPGHVDSGVLVAGSCGQRSEDGVYPELGGVPVSTPVDVGPVPTYGIYEGTYSLPPLPSPGIPTPYLPGYTTPRAYGGIWRALGGYHGQ